MKLLEKGMHRLSLVSTFAVTMLLAMVLLACASHAAAPGTYNITGRVTDTYGTPIILATVSLENGGSVKTGDGGYFSIPATTGNHTLTVSGDGWEAQTVEVTVGSEDLDVGTVQISPAPMDPLIWYGAIAMALVIAAAMFAYLIYGGRKQDRESKEKKP